MIEFPKSDWTVYKKYFSHLDHPDLIYSKSHVFENIMVLINNDMITVDELSVFSELMQDAVKTVIKINE